VSRNDENNLTGLQEVTKEGVEEMNLETTAENRQRRCRRDVARYSSFQTRAAASKKESSVYSMCFSAAGTSPEKFNLIY